MEVAEFSISDIVTALRGNKIKVFLCFSLIMGVAVALSLFLPREYASEAQLLVRLGRENATIDGAVIGQAAQVNISQQRAFETNSIATMLRSQPLAERVVDAIGEEAILDDDQQGDGSSAGAQSVFHGIAAAKDWLRSFVPRGVEEAGPRDLAVRKLKDGLQVEPVLETNVVRVYYQSHDPGLSQRVVSSVIDNYLEEHVRIHSAPGTHEFLMEHVDRLDAELSGAETELVELKRRTGLVSPLEQRIVLVDRIGALKTELFTLQATIAESQAEVDGLTESLAKIEAGESSELLLVGATSEEADGMRTQLYQLQLESEALLTKYTPDHVKAKRLRSQISAAKNLLATQEATLEIQQRKPFLTSQRAKAQTLQEQIAEVENELGALNENEMHISQLQRAVEIRDSTYRQVAEEAEQSRIDHSLELAKITNISVVQPATRDVFAVFPNTTLNLLVGLFAGIFASTGLALFCESRRLQNTAIRGTGAVSDVVTSPAKRASDVAEPSLSVTPAPSEEEVLSTTKPR